MERRKFSVGARIELLVPLLVIVFLIVSCIIVSPKKYFWNDEFFSYYFVSDSSFLHMLSAFHDKLNNTPILYFLFGWIWDKIFGSSELSLRLFSSLGFCIACLALWITLRRIFSFWPTAIGILGVFCTSSEIFKQNVEARMYGMFFALTAIALYLFDKIYTRKDLSLSLLIANGVIHAAIIHTHLFGPFYSAGFFIAFVLIDMYFKMFRPKLYLSIIASWLTFLLYIPSFLQQADAGKPHTWMPFPTKTDLLDFYNLSSYLDASILPPLILISAFAYIVNSAKLRPTSLPAPAAGFVQSKVPLLLIAFVFITIPTLVWIFSRTIKPIFWDRYMLPSAIGVVILLAFFTSRLFKFSFPDKQAGQSFRKISLTNIGTIVINCGLVVISLYLLWQPIRQAKRFEQQVFPNENEITGHYPGLPVVFLESGSFLESHFYSEHKDRYYYILDWEAASNNKSGVWATQEFKHLDAFRRNFPPLFKNNILRTDEFLRLHDRFLAVSPYDDSINCKLKPIGLAMGRSWVGMHCPQWVKMRFQNNSSYRVSLLQKWKWYTVTLVEKIADRP